MHRTVVSSSGVYYWVTRVADHLAIPDRDPSDLVVTTDEGRSKLSWTNNSVEGKNVPNGLHVLMWHIFDAELILMNRWWSPSGTNVTLNWLRYYACTMHSRWGRIDVLYKGTIPPEILASTVPHSKRLAWPHFWRWILARLTGWLIYTHLFPINLPPLFLVLCKHSPWVSCCGTEEFYDIGCLYWFALGGSPHLAFHLWIEPRPEAVIQHNCALCKQEACRFQPCYD